MLSSFFKSEQGIDNIPNTTIKLNNHTFNQRNFSTIEIFWINLPYNWNRSSLLRKNQTNDKHSY